MFNLSCDSVILVCYMALAGLLLLHVVSPGCVWCHLEGVIRPRCPCWFTQMAANHTDCWALLSKKEWPKCSKKEEQRNHSALEGWAGPAHSACAAFHWLNRLTAGPDSRRCKIIPTSCWDSNKELVANLNLVTPSKKRFKVGHCGFGRSRENLGVRVITLLSAQEVRNPSFQYPLELSPWLFQGISDSGSSISPPSTFLLTSSSSFQILKITWHAAKIDR